MITTHDVLFEDNHFIAVNKRAGILSQGDITGDPPLIDQVKHFLKIKYNKPGNVYAGLAHRLDRPVSGVVLIAKTSKGLERINGLFRKRMVEKKYLALVSKFTAAPQGELNHWLLKDGSKNKTSAFAKEKSGSKLATLKYRLISKKSDAYLLEINPLTGRPHQIRVQLAEMGSPIKGDLKYGYPAPMKDKSVCLHAYQLSFIHPVSHEPVVITAQPPDSGAWTAFKGIL